MTETLKPSTQAPVHVELTRQLEEASGLDPVVDAVAPVATKVFGTGARGAVLRGDWLGHAVHPIATDVVVGTWLSASVLDLVGGRAARPAAQRLVATGLLAAGPTAWTGWAEWSRAGQRERRVGLVHAVSAGAAIGVYAASWRARNKGHHLTGAGLSLGGSAVMGAAAYLGGHLAIARDVGSHHEAFSD